MTDTQIARVTLATAASSILLTWLIWITTILSTGTILVALGDSWGHALPPGFRWWHIPAMLLGPWLVVGTMMSLIMAGSTRLSKAATSLITAALLLPLIAKLALTPEAQSIFNRLLFAILASAIVIGTAWIFALARRRALIQAPALWAAVGLWIAGFLLAVFQWPFQLEPRWFGYVLAAAAFALSVAPFAAAPLALASNRHR